MQEETTLLNQSPTLTSRHYWIVFLCWAGWVFDFYDLILYAFLLIPIGQEFHFSKQELSWIYSFTLLMTGAGGILFGMLSDRFGRKGILQWTIVAYCLGTFLCAFTHSFWWLLIWRAVTGLGIGGEWGAGHTLISETFPASKRGRFGAWMQSGAPIGVGLAAIMGGFFAPHFGWRVTFAVSALPAAMVILVRRFMPESDVWKRHKEKHELPRYGELLAKLLGPEYRRITILTFVLTCFNMCAYWFTYSWFPGYLKEDKSLSIAQSGYWTLGIVAGELVGYTTFGYLSDRYGRRNIFTIFAWLMAAGLAVISMSWQFFYGYPMLLLVLLIVTGIGSGTWSNFGPMFAELYPTRIRNTALNTLLNAARATQFVTPLLITTFSARYGLVVGIWLGAFFSFLAGLWIWLLPETKGRIITPDQ
jgi:MFS family permease